MSQQKSFGSRYSHNIDTTASSSAAAALALPTALNIFDSGIYLNCLQTYYAYFGIIPSYKIIHSIDYARAAKWVEDRFANSIQHKHIKEAYDNDKKKMNTDNVLYILDDKIIIDIEDNGCVCVGYYKEMEDKAQHIINDIKKFIERPKKEQLIHVITNSRTGLDLSKIKCPKPKMTLEHNYNDDLSALHKDIIKSLSKNDKSGLLLFYGIPGTGKSTYLRYLISSIKKQFIFLSPKIAGNLDAPNFTDLLLANRNSVLIIEDAEDLLSCREKSSNSAISILLNLTDGILGESLGIQIICTFNTHIQNIDQALLRKGRLMAMYEFKELAADKATALLKKSGINDPAHSPMTLADIYNAGEHNFGFVTKRQKIGFAMG